MTLKQLAQETLDVQSACNASGVAHSLSKVMTALWEEAHRLGEGTNWVNKHPITQLWVDKLASLAGVQGTDWDFSAAYKVVEELAKGAKS